MADLGIVIANTGSPSAPTPDAVRCYLREFLSDPRICPMNPVLWKFILNKFILPRRSVASAEKYQSIWGEQGSPLAVHMTSLARKLESELDGCVVRAAMSYGSPSLLEVAGELRERGCTRLVVIPLYPQSAYSTTSVVKDKLTQALEALAYKPRLDLVENYGEHELYLDALAESVRAAGFSEGDALVMTFHSVPMNDINAGDTYETQAHATARALARRLSLEPERWRIGFQCRFDSRKWVGPFAPEAVRSLEVGAGRLFVVAPNFSIDCLETLCDIEVDLRRCFAEANPGAGEERFVYVPCLNDSDAQVRLLAALVGEACA